MNIFRGMGRVILRPCFWISHRLLRRGMIYQEMMVRRVSLAAGLEYLNWDVCLVVDVPLRGDLVDSGKSRPHCCSLFNFVEEVPGSRTWIVSLSRAKKDGTKSISSLSAFLELSPSLYTFIYRSANPSYIDKVSPSSEHEPEGTTIAFLAIEPVCVNCVGSDRGNGRGGCTGKWYKKACSWSLAFSPCIICVPSRGGKDEDDDIGDSKTGEHLSWSVVDLNWSQGGVAS